MSGEALHRPCVFGNSRKMRTLRRFWRLHWFSRKLDGDLYDLFHRGGWILENEKPTQMKYNRATAELEDMNRADGTQESSSPHRQPMTVNHAGAD